MSDLLSASVLSIVSAEKRFFDTSKAKRLQQLPFIFPSAVVW